MAKILSAVKFEELEERSTRESIRPRKMGSEFRYSYEPAIKIKQQRLDKRANNGSRKQRNLFEEEKNEVFIAKKRHARRQAEQEKFNELLEDFISANNDIDDDVTA